MSQACDVFADQFQLNISPYGCTVNFLTSHPEPALPGATPRSERELTVRVTPQLLKVMVLVMRRHMRDFEQKFGVCVEVPKPVLNQLGIGQEDWEDCWGE